jgi:hypothetical protein
MRVSAWSLFLFLVELLGSAGLGATPATNVDGAARYVAPASSAVEPSPWLMLVGGLGLLGMLMRFRRHRID